MIITTLNYPKSVAMGFSEGLKHKFETAMVNEPSVFEPLKFYCSLIFYISNCDYNLEYSDTNPCGKYTPDTGNICILFTKGRYLSYLNLVKA